MNCSNCDIEVQASNSICPSCSSLLSSSDVGSLASPAKRLVSYFFDYVIGMFLMFLVVLG